MKPKVTYFKDTDTLAIEIVDRPAREAVEIADDVLIDYDADHEIVGIVIEHARWQLSTMMPEPVSRT